MALLLRTSSQAIGARYPNAAFTAKRPLLYHIQGVRRALNTATEKQPKTFSNQSKLPRLPIPELKGTAERYKRSLLPLLSSAEHAKVSQKVDQFINKDGLGPKLQERLQALDKQETPKGVSWLDELWLNKGYLEYRIPTLINVNWWNQFQDPPQGLAQGVAPGKASEPQLQRAANIAVSLINYSNKVNNEEITPDVSRSGPFCMNQLKKMFGASRIAANPRDKIVTSWPATAKHITVIYKDQIFSVPVFDAEGQVLSDKAMTSQLRRVVEQVDKVQPELLQPPVGIMTTEHRDTWANVREQLESNPKNANTLKDIDTSLFVISLDDYSAPSDIDQAHRNMFHGTEGRNRWFDKALSFIVENNGRAGVNGEIHAPADAIIPFTMFGEIIKSEQGESSNINVSAPAPPTWLSWDITPSISDALKTAQSNAAKLINDIDSVLLHYHGYGSNLMKKAKVSPDGWMQMAFQLAYFRQHGKSVPTYEAASTRKFLTGRTETVRTLSVDTVAFTKAWEDDSVKMEDKLALMNKAIGSHLEYMKAAVNGMGVDRHLLGLRCMMTPEEASSEAAAIFQDPSYVNSQYWILSTSNVSPGDLCYGGFGAVVPEGYGIAYAVDKERIRISMSSWNSYPETDTPEFRNVVSDILDEFGEVAEKYLIK
ncbi:acyltransferase ChoActase/COT/CPT [Phascolomyces articulosus]|uniref:Acyltransferase ChoActase/COT/CPT n=1 Tax=Phascolomyces articulosus TaxID=60185 RepID=A0AAD5KFG5_9FUNG|nr:acyltransferase ChoActase/COT/CPT [Phascolomyces articulosus]